MLPGIRPGVLLIDRFDGHAVAAKAPDVMTPPRRRPGNGCATRVAGLKQAVEGPGEPASENLRRLVVNAGVELDRGEANRSAMSRLPRTEGQIGDDLRVTFGDVRAPDQPT